MVVVVFFYLFIVKIEYIFLYNLLIYLGIYIVLNIMNDEKKIINFKSLKIYICINIYYI